MTFWGQRVVTFMVNAVVINHVMSLNPSHYGELPSCKAAGPVRRDRNGAAFKGGVGGATTGFEVGVLTYKWLVSIICFVFPIFCCP